MQTPVRTRLQIPANFAVCLVENYLINILIGLLSVYLVFTKHRTATP